MPLTPQLVLWSPKIGDVNFTDGASSIAESISAAGINPGATGSDRVLAIMTIPAGALDAATRGVNIIANGSSPNTNSKTIKLIANPTNPSVGAAVSGGTLLATMTSTAAGGWVLEANLFKVGAQGSNTQVSSMLRAQGGATPLALTAPITNLTLNEAAPITVVVTGNAATAAGDCVFNFAQMFAMN